MRENSPYGEPVCVLIYRKESDWWADVVFFNEEAGGSNRVGIPTDSPASSRAEAIEYAVDMLSGWARAKTAQPATSNNTIMIDGKRVKVIMC